MSFGTKLLLALLSWLQIALESLVLKYSEQQMRPSTCMGSRQFVLSLGLRGP